MLKKISFLGLIFLFSIMTANAQFFRQGKIGINAGGTLLLIGNITPGVNLSAEYGVLKIKKKFTLGVGASSDLVFFDPDIKAYHAGIRTALHWGNRDTRTFDVYGGVGLGLPFYDDHEFAYNVYINTFIGFRVKVFKQFGFFGEIGLGSTNARAGIMVILPKN